MSGQHPADDMERPWEQYARLIRAERIKEGRCADCGVFDGATHRCPTLNRVAPATTDNEEID